MSNAQAYRKLGMEIGADTEIYGTIEPHFPHLIHIGKKVIFGGESKIIAHGPIRPFKENAEVRIGDLSYIGFRCLILLDSTIGRGSVVGAGSVVANHFPPYSIIAGNPAKVVRPITGKELVRYFVCRWLMGNINPKQVNWKLLKKEHIEFIFDLPRAPIGPNDPAHQIMFEGLENLSIRQIIEMYR